MEKQFTSYKIALKLKELGFNEDVIATFDTEVSKELKIFAFTVPNKGIFEKGFKEGWCIKAPTWQQCISFLNEKGYRNSFGGYISSDFRSIEQLEYEICKILGI